MGAAISCAALSRIPQIFENFSQRHTGVLSPEVYFLNVAGSLARVFTTSTEVSEGFLMTMANAVNGVVLNAILLVQIVMYRSRTAEMMEKSAPATKKKKKKKN